MGLFNAMQVTPSHSRADVQEFVGDGTYKVWPGGLGGYLVITVDGGKQNFIVNDGDFVMRGEDGTIGVAKQFGVSLRRLYGPAFQVVGAAYPGPDGLDDNDA